uniref:Uncharacterized protein n=1 Tax=Anguilla anguilla TaxID=7936 RepID=A0A0E9RA42_ANGAN
MEIGINLLKSGLLPCFTIDADPRFVKVLGRGNIMFKGR